MLNITRELLHDRFTYKDGKLLWKTPISNKGVIGEEAGCVATIGYRLIGINGKRIWAHRLVWLYHYGFMPENGIDHIDQNPLNNRIENLREVSKQCNMVNSPTSRANKSGVKGVSWYKRDGSWAVQMSVNGKADYIGRYKDFTEAVAVRLACEQCVGWDECDKTSSAFIYMRNYSIEYKGHR
jgi:hypothetical protein